MALQARRQKGQEPGRERVELKVFCKPQPSAAVLGCASSSGKLRDLSHAL